MHATNTTHPSPSVQFSGHVMTLAGSWTADDVDTFFHAAHRLRDSLPRTSGRKVLTLLLINCTMSDEAAVGIGRIVHTTLETIPADVSVVVEGVLGGAALLVLAGAPSGRRKIFADARIEARIRTEAHAMSVGFGLSRPLSAQLAASHLDVLPQSFRQRLLESGAVSATAAEAFQAQLADKILHRP